MIRALELANAHLTLADERLHLVFEGNCPSSVRIRLSPCK